MSLQVLNPLPSPRCTPFLGDRFECRCYSPDSAGSEQFVYAADGPSTSRREETNYFPTSVSISITPSAVSQSRRVRFRPPVNNTTITTTTPTASQDCPPEEEKPEMDDDLAESLQVPTLIDPAKTPCPATATATTPGTLTVVTANHVTAPLHPPTKLKVSPSIGVKVNPAHCLTDVIVASATTAADNPLSSVARKINVLQRQSTVEEKTAASSNISGGTKLAQERLRRLSLRPTLMLNALRGRERAASNAGVAGIGLGGSGGAILANGVVKSSAPDSATAVGTNASSDNPTRRLTRFSSLLRAPSEVAADSDVEATNMSGVVDSSNDYSTDHRALLMEVLCCCCCCADGVGTHYGGTGSGGRGDCNSAPGGRRRAHRDGGAGSGGGSDRRGDYANLIENHRLARLVTLLAVLAILGLVLTYIIKSVVEQQQQHQTTTSMPESLFRNSS